MMERSCATGAGFAVRLVFLGRMRPETVEEIRAALAPGSLRASFPGELPPEEALAALAGCDVMARPSVTDGVSFAVLEAMALGLPVVAFAAGGLAEAVVDGVTGLLVPVRGTPAPVARASRRRWRSTAPSRTVPEATADVRAMAAALAQLAADSALCRRLGEAGRRRVREEFPERRMLDAYEAAFRLAAARGRPPASRTIAQASDAARSQLR
jgi:glycosyltransferase involved in cell wall biosynthesis